MHENTLTVPEENRTLVVVGEERTIRVPGEWRVIEVGTMSLIQSKQHTVGDTRRWTVTYEDWLANTATIETIDVQSSSPTCTVGDTLILGREIVFFLSGGTLNERLTVTLTMTDDLGNIKTDTISFTVVAA
jgi:hypothetical protein